MCSMNVSGPTNPWIQTSSNSPTELEFHYSVPLPKNAEPQPVLWVLEVSLIFFGLGPCDVPYLTCFWSLPFYCPRSAYGCSPAHWCHIPPRLSWATPPRVLRRENTAVYFGSHFVTWEQSSMACAFVPHTIVWDNNCYGFCLWHFLSQNLGLKPQGQAQKPKSTSNTILTSLLTSSHCINCTGLILSMCLTPPYKNGGQLSDMPRLNSS